MLRALCVAMSCMFLLLSCMEEKKRNSQLRTERLKSDSLPGNSGPEAQGPADVESFSREILLALENKDFHRLSQYVHPEKGVRLSPYGYINLSSDKVFHRAAIKNFWDDPNRYLWGHYDGSGEAILLSPKDYYKRFIFDMDFTNAPEAALDSVLGTGNSLLNHEEVYPAAHFMEFHYPGIHPDYGGMDWKSLRLFFEMYRGNIYLVGIAHDQWTI